MYCSFTTYNSSCCRLPSYSSRDSLNPLHSTSLPHLTSYLTNHLTTPPHLQIRIRGTCPTHSFDFTIDATKDLKAGLRGGRKAVVYVAERDDDDEGVEKGRRGCVEDEERSVGCGWGMSQKGEKSKGAMGRSRESGVPGFIRTLSFFFHPSTSLTFSKLICEASSINQSSPTDPSSLIELPSSSPHSSLSHPPLLFQNIFTDMNDIHSSLPPSSSLSSHHQTQVNSALTNFCSSQNPLRTLRLETETYGFNWDRIRSGTYRPSLSPSSSPTH